MRFHVLTLFPQMILDGLNTSITGRAIQNGILSVDAVNIRDFAENKYMKVDDYPYGGGAGLVMQPGPVCSAYKSVTERIGKKPRVVYMTPQGYPFTQQMAQEFAQEEDLCILCGHYEGIDQRFIDECVDEEISTFVPDGPEEGEYNLVRSKRFPIKPMTRDEAILQMNLLGHSFFAFRDEDADGAFAVVYCRNDGDYGLIEDEA